jgi:hypothetical protein
MKFFWVGDISDFGARHPLQIQTLSLDMCVRVLELFRFELEEPERKRAERSPPNDDELLLRVVRDDPEP